MCPAAQEQGGVASLESHDERKGQRGGGARPLEALLSEWRVWGRVVTSSGLCSTDHPCCCPENLT